MNNQPQISMTITGLMLKTYMVVARTWASTSKTIRDVKELTSMVSQSVNTMTSANA